MPMSDTTLTFKEMCAKFDVTPRTLRYYEYIELLQPERQGRSRFYGPRECARMTLILRGRKFGFALEDIRQWLLIYEHEGTEAQMRSWIGSASGIRISAMCSLSPCVCTRAGSPRRPSSPPPSA